MNKRLALTTTGGLAAFLIAVGCASSPGGGDGPTDLPTVAVTTTTPKPSPKPPTTKPQAISKEQEQAIKSAQSYLEMQGFSRKGLIQQLSSDAGEGFPVKVATAAVDSLNIDWNEQAARVAKSYLDTQTFSRKGLIQQLESSAGEGFTHEQAVYGVNHSGL